MKRIILIAVFTALVSTVSAHPDHQTEEEHVDTVIVTSSANYPDTFISEPASETIGAPVLVTEKDELSESTAETISELGAKEAILVGGPAVLSEKVESKVDSEVESTTRLWGTSQVGTSVEVSNYFWTSIEEATIIQYPEGSEEGYKLLAKAAEETEGTPILLSKEGTLSATVLSEIEKLGAKEVDVYSTDSTNVTDDLEKVGVEEVDIEEGSMEELSVQSQAKNTSRIVIVAASGFGDVISAASAPGASLIVSSESEISTAVEKGKSSSATTIHVTGRPDLAEKIGERLLSETEKEVDVLTGRPDQVSANLTQQARKEWSQEQQKKLGKWKEEAKNAPGLEKAANKTIRNAERAINENSSQKARNLLKDARSSYENGEYFEAREKAVKAHSIARSESFRQKSWEEVMEEAEDEREDLREASKELRESGKEMAEELKKAETVEERLEIIREHREEAREAAKELKEEAREKRKEVKEERREAKEELEEDIEGDSSDDYELKLEVEESQVKAEVEYTGNTGGYTKETNVNRGNGTIEFVFNFKSPSGPATQVITEYNAEKEITAEQGNYTTSVILQVDGNTLDELEQGIIVPNMEEYELKPPKKTEEEGDEEDDKEVPARKPPRERGR